MPLPTDERMPWPPKEWGPVYARYAEHDAWYSGDPERLADEYGSELNWIGKRPWWKFWSRQKDETAFRRSRSQLHVPLAGDLASLSSALIFGEAPRILMPEDESHEFDIPTQERIERITEEGDFLARMLEAAEACSALGGVFLRPSWDVEVADVPFLAVE